MQRAQLVVLASTGHGVARVHALLTAAEVALHLLWEELTLAAWEAEHQPNERRPRPAGTRAH